MGIFIRQIKRVFLILTASFYGQLFAVSITLDNDSNFPLNAQIIDALGRHLALIPLHPGQTYIYDISQGAFDPNTNQPYTPLTVIFLCRGARPYDYAPGKKKPDKNEVPNKSEYINQFGVWTGVARGSYVNALGSPAGSKSCVVKKDPQSKTKKKSSSLSINSGANNWSNDGGQNWTNDAGSGLGSCTENGRACSGERKNTTSKESSTNDNDQAGGSLSKSENATEKNKVRKQTPVGNWSNDGGETWTNDQEQSSDKHVPSKQTPLPFVERN